MSDEREEKRMAVEAFLQQGLTSVLIDSRQPGVVVPANLRQEALLLNISRAFAPPDLSVEAWGIRETLSFNGAGFYVEVPWEAVYSARAKNGEIVAWLPPAEPPPIGKRRGILGVVQ